MANPIIRTNSLFAVTKNAIFNKKFKFANIEIDNVISFNTDQRVTVTKQPLEIGADINDHKFEEASFVSCQISESKFKNVIQQINNVAQNFREIGTDIISGDFLNKDNSFYEENEATAKLQELVVALKQLDLKFDLDTPNQRFTNMTLERINVNNTIDTSGGFSATLEFSQLLIVDTTSGPAQIGAIINKGLKQKVDYVGNAIDAIGGLF